MLIRTNTLFLLFVFILNTTLAQESPENLETPAERVLNVDKFFNLKLYSGIELKLIKSTENKLVIIGENRMDVVVKNKGNTLKIRHSFKHLLDRSFTYIELHHTENLDRIHTYQGSKLETINVNKQTSITLKVHEGSTVIFSFDGEKLTSNVSSGGKLFLKGKSTNHELTVFSGGVCEAETFETEQTKVSVTAGGLSYVKASELIDAKVTAGGTIRIHGRPKKLVTQKNIGGKIIEMN
jgi:3-deoxy-D-manno-octulosonate 8-phosphate phosphatase KdsC-like HAD superfamily phosphatase|tara:strand:- start:706 stop:1419 length:714 start_codon:yes stop_codon:yes gene_type:complete